MGFTYRLDWSEAASPNTLFLSRAVQLNSEQQLIAVPRSRRCLEQQQPERQKDKTLEQDITEQRAPPRVRTSTSHKGTPCRRFLTFLSPVENDTACAKEFTV